MNVKESALKFHEQSLSINQKHSVAYKAENGIATLLGGNRWMNECWIKKRERVTELARKNFSSSRN